MSSPHDTPAMRQFHRFKKEHPDCILFFRMGDFYELFYDDAKVAAKTLSLALTQRTQGIPMAGVPYHSVEGYLRRMIAAGHRVAICEQMEDPAQAKGVIQRQVTRLVTPGTLTDEALLDESSENPLAAIQFIDESQAAVAVAELSTGSFTVALFAADRLVDELARLRPRELLHVETADRKPPPRIQQVGSALSCPLTPRPSWQFRSAEAAEILCKQFRVTTLTGFGFSEGDPLIGPAGAAVAYLLQTQQAAGGRLPHLRPPRRYEPADHLIIDQVSLRSLEVERTLRSGEVAGSLLATLGDCRTPMGKRTLRHWLCFPLKEIPRIQQRQSAVAAVVDDPRLSEDLLKQLEQVQDVQRISSRIAIGRAGPRDLVGLGRSLGDNGGVAQFIELLAARPSFAACHQRLTAIAAPLDSLGLKLRRACVDAPPAHLREGGLIREGFDPQLDEFRALERDSNSFLAEYQKQLAAESGIASLKIGFNRVFGYYIEVTHTHAAKVPPTFTRKQTMRNAERYITPTLKEYEDKVLGASAKAIAREQQLFDELCAAVADHLTELHEYATVVAELDVLACFGRRAVRFQYVRPELVEKPLLNIVEGRHPVLDELLADRFVPNDIQFDPQSSLALITGPNMAGKSTYIRQAALLTLLAHTGSFIPAKSAVIGLTDRIFTRIGASDELHTGQSTFMVEMTETANICHHVSPCSLVILDEIGRGTSTLDGLALAWSIAEHLARIGCRTLFATHYHELTQLTESLPNIYNLNVTVREWADQVVFLHRIARGSADKSYGIHVAQIAGLPPQVILRARQLMDQLEVHTAPTSPLTGEVGRSPGRVRVNPNDTPDPTSPSPTHPAAASPTHPTAGSLRDPGQPQGSVASRLSAPPSPQLSLFTEYVLHPAVESLKSADLNNLTPIQAFDLLRKLKEELNQ